MVDNCLLKTKKIFYGWIILILCFLVLVASLGVRLSFGAFITSWEAGFNVTRGTITIISAISLITYGAFQPLAGRLSDLYGTRLVLSGSLGIIGLGLILTQWLSNYWTLLFLYGVFISIGFAGASNVAASAAVIQWFHKKRGFALGFVTSGMALGQMTLVPLSIYLVKHWNWEYTFLFYGCVILFILTPLTYLFLRSKPDDIGEKPYGIDSDNAIKPLDTKIEETPAQNSKGESLFNLLKIRNFWLLVIPFFFCGFTDLGLIATHLIPYAEGEHFNDELIALCISVAAFFNILGILLAGYVSDFVSRSKLLAAIYITRAVSFIILLNVNNSYELLIFGIVYGITDMATAAPVAALSAKLFGMYSIGVIIGITAACHQIGAAFGSYLPGLIYDFTNSYNTSIALSAIILFVVGILSLYINEKRDSIKQF